MFGLGKEAKAKEAARYQYDAAITISNNSIDEFAKCVGAALEKSGYVEPSEVQIKQLEYVEAIIATHMICGELILMREHLSQKNALKVFKACTQEAKNRVTKDNNISVAVYMWVHKRFDQLYNESNFDETSQHLHFNSIATACLLVDQYDGDKEGLVALTKDTEFHAALNETISQFSIMWVNYLHANGFK